MDGKVVEAKLLASPVTLAGLFWGERNLYDWQKAVLLNAWKLGSRTALVTPNEAGKTSCVVACLGLSWLAAYPGSQVVSTAGVFRQISQQLWPVLKAKLAMFPNWQVLEDRVIAPSVRGLPPATWIAFSAADEQKAEGYHSRRYTDKNGQEVYAPLLYIIDEAKGVKEGIFQAMYRCDPDSILVCSTPGETEGPFYDLVTSKPDGWNVYEITWEDCPHLRVGRKAEVRKRMIAELGEDNPFVQSFVYGRFSRAGDYFVFDRMDLVDAAMDGTNRHVRFEKRAAIDLSGGAEPTVLAWRDGNKVMPMECFKERDAAILARKLVDRLRELDIKPHETIADGGGQGDAIIDIMEDMGFFGIRRYFFNRPATDKSRFADKVAEDHFYLRSLIYRGEVILPHDVELREQMMRRTYKRKQDGEGLIDMTPKRQNERGGSPDKLDALVMLCSDLYLPSYARPILYGRKCPDWRPPEDKYAAIYGSYGMRFET